MTSQHLQYAVVNLVLCQRRLVERLPEHWAELIDIVDLDVNHRPAQRIGIQARKDGEAERREEEKKTF